MNWAYTEEQVEVRNLARKILEDLATHERLVAAEASDEGIDRELYTALGRANLLGIAIEQVHGGSDMGFFDLGMLLIEIGRSVAPLPCEANGDVNCSGSITSADIIYMVGHVFKGGAAPCDICLDSPLTCS